MGSYEVATMKFIAAVASLLMAVYAVIGDVKDVDMGELYPYPIFSNGTHSCQDRDMNGNSYDPCRWISNDDFMEEFRLAIYRNNRLYNETNGTLGDDQGITGVWFAFYTGCFPYCETVDGQRPWTEEGEEEDFDHLY